MLRRDFIAGTGAASLALAAPLRAAAVAPSRLRATLDAISADDALHDPEDATSNGFDTGRQAVLRSRLKPRSLAARSAELARNQGWLAKLARFDSAALSPAERRQLTLARYLIEQRTIAPRDFALDSVQRPYRLFQQGGAYFAVPDFLNSQHPIATKADAEAYLARLNAFATALDQDSAVQRAEAARGIVAPAWSLDLTLGQMAKLRGSAAAENGLVRSLATRAAAKGIAGDWANRAAAIVSARVYPALDRQMALVRELRRSTPAGDGAWRLQNGAAIYAAALRQATTTDMTPEQVHQTGLDQVADITAKLDAILREAGLTSGSVGERLTMLNRRPDQLYPDSAEGRRAMIASLNHSVSAMYDRLPRAFGAVPRLPLEIRAVPTEIQDGASNGYYHPSPLDGSRPAIYWINLKDVGDWPKYTLPSLTYHEGVPGHHLQFSYAGTGGELPVLLKTAFISSYGEGWALYAEQLADELGAYSGIERAGYLQSFLFRAARLVVDTGIHHYKWSREKATDYMVSTTGFARARSQREVERYCTQMGQACSYKIGHTAWVAQRAKAEKALGSKFDLPWFHAILSEGVMPLSQLDKRVDERIAERLRS